MLKDRLLFAGLLGLFLLVLPQRHAANLRPNCFAFVDGRKPQKTIVTTTGGFLLDIHERINNRPELTVVVVAGAIEKFNPTYLINTCDSKCTLANEVVGQMISDRGRQSNLNLEIASSDPLNLDLLDYFKIPYSRAGSLEDIKVIGPKAFAEYMDRVDPDIEKEFIDKLTELLKLNNIPNIEVFLKHLLNAIKLFEVEMAILGEDKKMFPTLGFSRLQRLIFVEGIDRMNDIFMSILHLFDEKILEMAKYPSYAKDLSLIETLQNAKTKFEDMFMDELVYPKFGRVHQLVLEKSSSYVMIWNKYPIYHRTGAIYSRQELVYRTHNCNNGKGVPTKFTNPFNTTTWYCLCTSPYGGSSCESTAVFSPLSKAGFTLAFLYLVVRSVVAVCRRKQQRVSAPRTKKKKE